MSTIDWNYEQASAGIEAYDRSVAEQAMTLPEKVRTLAHLLWSIERHGDLLHLEETAAPLHYDMAQNIFEVPGAAEAIRETLSKL